MSEATQTREFLRDSTGRPQVFFHGTNKPFTSFDEKSVGSNTGEGWLGNGFYFSPHRDAAESYGSTVIEAVLAIERPFEFPRESIRSDLSERRVGRRRSRTGSKLRGTTESCPEKCCTRSWRSRRSRSKYARRSGWMRPSPTRRRKARGDALPCPVLDCRARESPAMQTELGR